MKFVSHRKLVFVGRVGFLWRIPEWLEVFATMATLFHQWHGEHSDIFQQYVRHYSPEVGRTEMQFVYCR